MRGKSEETGWEAHTCPEWTWAGGGSCLQPCDTPLRPRVGKSTPSLGAFSHPHHLFPCLLSVHTKGALCCGPDAISGATCRPPHMSTLTSDRFQSDLKIKSFGFLCRRSQNKQDNKDCVAQCGLRSSLPPQRSSIMNEWLICLAMLQVNNSHAC